MNNIIYGVFFLWVITQSLNFMCRRFGTLNSEEGESPKGKNTTFTTRRKF